MATTRGPISATARRSRSPPARSSAALSSAAVALALAALAVVFRYGSALQHQTEALQRETEGLV